MTNCYPKCFLEIWGSDVDPIAWAVAAVSCIQPSTGRWGWDSLADRNHENSRLPMSDDLDRTIRPFRWDLSRREQLGDLLAGEAAAFPGEDLAELRSVTARAVALAGDSDLVFVGRSPENLFDYLSGAFAALKQPRSLTLLQLSMPGYGEADPDPGELAPLLDYFRAEKLDPQALASYGKAVRFVDVVDMGSTFLWLLQLLRDWSRREGADWNVVRRRIGFIGLTCREKSSPNTYRWQQHDDWRAQGAKISAKNVSVSPALWSHIAGTGVKVTISYRRDRWGRGEAARPPRTDEALKALRGAVELYDLARTRAERQAFARTLSAQPAMAEPWLRHLVLDLKASGAS